MVNNGSIIIIEDDVDDQELLADIFKELKIPNLIRFFASCMQALNYLVTTIEMEIPFLIISDINLPAMTGMELCKKIKENNSFKMKSIPFVFLTTTSDRKVIAEAYEMNVQGFFVKPTSLGELRDTMKMIVDYWRVNQWPHVK